MRSFSLLFSLLLLGAALPMPLSLFGTSAKAASHGGGVVYFNRPANFGAAFKRPVVVIDGKEIGTIGSGECHGVRLPAGPHKVVVRDEQSIPSRFGIELIGTKVYVNPGAETFVTVRPVQEMKDFNESSPVYDLLVSDDGQPCR